MAMSYSWYYNVGPPNVISEGWFRYDSPHEYYSYSCLFAYHKPVREIGVICAPQLNAIPNGGPTFTIQSGMDEKNQARLRHEWEPYFPGD